MAGYINFQDLALQSAPQVHVATMEALVRHESGFNPNAIGVNGKYKLPHQPKTKAEAIKQATWLKKHGYNFDAGLGQINVNNMASLGLTIPDLFDPCKNLQASAKVLISCYERASMIYKDDRQIIHAALSCYNTGNFKRGLSNGYVNKVLQKLPIIKPSDIEAFDHSTDPQIHAIVPNLVKINYTYEKEQAAKRKKALLNKKRRTTLQQKKS